MDTVNLIDIWTAGVEGFALAISPCVLSILPIVLSTSVDGGRWRPLGVVAGLMVSFAGFALFLDRTLEAAGLGPEFMRMIATLFIVMFALIMLIPPLNDKFAAATARFSSLGHKLSAGLTNHTPDGGLLAGIIVGACLGLIWTPCVGPLIGTAFLQVASQETFWHSIVVTFAFCVGASVPMLLLAFCSKFFLAQVNFLKQNSGLLRQVAALVILATVFSTSQSSLELLGNWFRVNLFGQPPVYVQNFDSSMGCKLPPVF